MVSSMAAPANADRIGSHASAFASSKDGASKAGGLEKQKSAGISKNSNKEFGATIPRSNTVRAGKEELDVNGNVKKQSSGVYPLASQNSVGQSSRGSKRVQQKKQTPAQRNVVSECWQKKDAKCSTREN